jgi:hypothetical protein
LVSNEHSLIPQLLPSSGICAAPEKGINAAHTNADGASRGDSTPGGNRRFAQLEEQYVALLASLPFLKAPCVMDLVAIIGSPNAVNSARLLSGLCALKPSFKKESVDTIKESLKVFTGS